MAKKPTVTLSPIEEITETFRQQELPDFIFPKANMQFPVGQQYFHNGHDLRNRLVVFDTETTGLNTSKDRIIEISGVVIDWEGNTPVIPAVLIHAKMNSISDKESDEYKALEAELKNVEFHDYLALPNGMKIPPETTKVHKITDDFLEKHGRDPKEVLEEFKAFVGDSIMIGHNAVGFDAPILASNCLRLGVDGFKNTIIDTLIMARQRFQSLGKYNLDFLCKTLNVSLKERESGHSADVDSRLLAQVVRVMVLGCGKELDDFKINAANLDLKKVDDDSKTFSIAPSELEIKEHKAYMEKNGFPVF